MSRLGEDVITLDMVRRAIIDLGLRNGYETVLLKSIKNIERTEKLKQPKLKVKVQSLQLKFLDRKLLYYQRQKLITMNEYVDLHEMIVALTK